MVAIAEKPAYSVGLATECAECSKPATHGCWHQLEQFGHALCFDCWLTEAASTGPGQIRLTLGDPAKREPIY